MEDSSIGILAISLSITIGTLLVSVISNIFFCLYFYKCRRGKNYNFKTGRFQIGEPDYDASTSSFYIMQAFSIMDKLRVGPLSFVVLFSEVTKLMHHYCRDNLSFVQRLSLFLEGQILEIVYAVVLLPRRYQKALQKKNTP